MRLIPLTQGKSATVDDRDHEWLMRAGPWHAERGQRGQGGWYAVKTVRVNGKRTKLGMHSAIMGTFTLKETVPDHRDGDGLNNQRANLRRATRAQNGANARKPITGRNTSRYKGVSVGVRRPGVFHAQIGIKGRGKSLGYFRIEEDAARAYDNAASAAFGEFAKLNFPWTPKSEQRKGRSVERPLFAG